MNSFEINEDLLEALDEYHQKSMLMEKHIIEGVPFKGDGETDLKDYVNDDLIWNVPIYDMGNRKYAAFCSFTEAVWKKEKDVKGNGIFFKDVDIDFESDWFLLFYLFRLCGSGINYKPKTSDSFLGTHGFGNFWVIECLRKHSYYPYQWFQYLERLDKPFTDNKGYILPQFSYPNQKGGHLKRFIVENSIDLISAIYVFCLKEKREIYQVTDFGNEYLRKKGFKRQNFVLTAFAADLAEYFPNYVDPNSQVYAGTAATKCIKTIFPKKKGIKRSEFDYINDVLRFQSKRYNLTPISCEDSRNCDVVRYFKEYQSKDHIKKNNGKVMKNNSVLKSIWGKSKYDEFKNTLN